MLRFKVVLLSMFAVVAFGAITSASASAADSCNGGTHIVFCTFPGNLPITHLAVAGESGLSVLASKVGLVEVKIHCTHDKFAGTLKLLGLAIGEISFLGCTVEKPAGCTTTNLIGAELHIQAESTTKGLATGTKNNSTKEFATVAISGAGCGIPVGNYTVTGTQEVEFPTGGTGKVEQEIVAKKAGSKLKFGAEPASFSSTAKVHLDNNESWLLMAGE